MSNTRSDRGFRFPLQKYSDEKALYTNFRYLQEYMNYIRRKDKFAATVDVALKGSDAEARAQFVADGTNDHTDIQAALDALPSDGGHIYFHEGTYDIQATISLPAKKVILSGPGTFSFNGTTTNFGNGFTGASGGKYIIHGGLSFTGDVRHSSQSDRGALVFHQNDAEWYFSGCRFYSLSAEVIFSGGSHTVVNNEFHDIELRRGTNVTDESVIIGRVDGSNANAFGVFAGNYLDGLTTTAATFSNDSYYIAKEDSGHIFVVGNHFDDVNGLTSNFSGDVIHSHNKINSTMVSGDHSDVGHGTLSGLTDDDHTQYVLRSILTAAGDLAYRDGSDWTRLALGTDGQVLQVNTGATAPEWATIDQGAAFSEMMLIGA